MSAVNLAQDKVGWAAHGSKYVACGLPATLFLILCTCMHPNSAACDATPKLITHTHRLPLALPCLPDAT
jgi:hypothetical protein